MLQRRPVVRVVRERGDFRLQEDGMRDIFWRPAEERRDEPRPALYAPCPVPPAFRPDVEEQEAGRPADDDDEPRVIIIDL